MFFEHAARRWFFFVLTLVAAECGGVGELRAAEPSDHEVTRPRIVAHRGLLRHAPENTLANFRACLNLGLGFEVDVRRSRDGQLVCVHDTTLDRTTNGTGPVGQVSLEQLKQLDAGSWFDARYTGERIPTLSEVFALLADYPRADVLVAVDVKGDDAEIEGAIALEAARYRVQSRLLMIGRTIDHPPVRHRFKAADSRIATAALANTPGELTAAIEDAESDWVYVRFVPTRAQLDAVHQAGKQAFIAGPTVAGREPKNWQLASAAGIDAILTDFPLDLAKAATRVE